MKGEVTCMKAKERDAFLNRLLTAMEMGVKIDVTDLGEDKCAMVVVLDGGEIFRLAPHKSHLLRALDIGLERILDEV
ncbi:hypothetical protein [Candidatus Macondimonas diazotrophica]|nr:hypothetical protein [Candidatus Macondimonas diazotrophica]